MNILIIPEKKVIERISIIILLWTFLNKNFSKSKALFNFGFLLSKNKDQSNRKADDEDHKNWDKIPEF